MIDITELDNYYKTCISNLNKMIPDSILNIDLNLLHKLDLLHFQPGQREHGVTRYFHLIESPDKITLVNEQFVIWISSRKNNSGPFTCTMIALNQNDHPHLEMAFMASGVYNTSHLVMQVLEKFLIEIQDNEELLNRLSTKS